GKNDMFANGVDVGGGVTTVHVVEMSLVGMVIEISDVGVLIGVFDVDTGEGIYVRYVGSGVDINGADIGAKDEYDVVDWGMIEVDKLYGVVTSDANV
ncbi:hypothetical protein KI387_034229, partial [Taxus chinensis]